MEGLSFKLEIFEGPLDLMLALIQKHKLNIQDIEISVLLDQFMLYLDRMSEADLEITSDFLEMAARLIMIKSAALLPKEEAEEMKKELQGALIEYALCKTMAGRLKKRYLGDVVFVRKPMELEIDRAYHKTHLPEELMLAYGSLNERTRRKQSYRPRSIKPIVAKSYVTVFTGIVAVLKSLRKQGTVSMEELYKNQPRSRTVATFLAILELSKEGRIFISEDGGSVRLRTKADDKPKTETEVAEQ
ncbi:MAG: segregation and condensation protein A [Oscillospiraceae bacterium]